MKARVLGLTLTAGLLVALGWLTGQQSLHAQKLKKGDAPKSNRFEVVSAGLITAVLVDHETGKTWALSTGSNDRFGPGDFGGNAQEFAWSPITKFDDLDSYRRWVKERQDRQKKLEEEQMERLRKADEEERKQFEKKKG